ncbi:MAG: hypothetical protein K9L70_11425 [Thiohalocapsa sp.]|nr:hypothetical protein [Thiohalocapsa sp.]MCF7991633.1 hypothetical protein [Thiohalocapsa sp.]
MIGEDRQRLVESPVAREDWPRFLDSFSEQHHGWLINIRQLRPGQSAHPDAAPPVSSPQVSPPLWPHDLPLHAIRLHRNGDRASIVVTAGADTAEAALTLEAVSALCARTRDGAHQGLRIDSTDGSSALIEFRVSATPDMLDGLAESEL